MLTAALAGLAAGGTYALLGVCAVFTYRLVAVVNFAGAAVGAVGTFTMVMLHQAGMPLLPAVILGLIAGTIASGLIGSVMSIWFAESDAQTKAAVTVAMLVGMIFAGLRITGGQHPRQIPNLFPGAAFSIDQVVITNAAVLTILLAVAFAVCSTLFLNRTRVGLLLRALSEHPMAAELMGIRTRLLSAAIWLVTGAATSAALMIVANEWEPNFMTLSELIVPAFAAALLGSFRSFWLTVAGGILLGLLEGVASNMAWLSQYRGGLPFIVIVAVLLWAQRGARWDEAR